MIGVCMSFAIPVGFRWRFASISAVKNVDMSK